MSDEAAAGLAQAAIDAGIAPDPRSSNGDPLAGSFEARIQQRRVEREQRTTELFEPPGFEDLFRVEMQVLGYRRLADLALKHQRQRDDAMRSLYLAADQVLAATVAFHLVKDDGTLDVIEDASWLTIARRMYPELDGTTRPRVALIRLLDGAGVLALNNQWYDWNTNGNTQVDRELSAVFPVTG